MIRLLIAGLLLSVSSFGWASVYPDKYEGVPKTFKDGDIIKAEDFNNNNLSIKKAINDIPAGATGACRSRRAIPVQMVLLVLMVLLVQLVLMVLMAWRLG